MPEEKLKRKKKFCLAAESRCVILSSPSLCNFYFFMENIVNVVVFIDPCRLLAPRSKVALNPMYRIFLNFAKSCVLSCLSKVDNIKKFHRAVFEL